MRLLVLSVVACAAAFAMPAAAQDRVLLERAFDNALDTFERALPRLGATAMGVPVADYRDALSLMRFNSSHWGGTVTVTTALRGDKSGSCTRFAAFVRIPPENGTVPLVLCPQFFSEGADTLRELTLLHEMVHVVAGPNECQAMAFAAMVQQASAGDFTPVDAYWQAHGCAGSDFSLP